MRSRTLIFLYAGLLLAATIAAGVWSFGVLRGEGERLRAAEQAARAGQAGVVAEKIVAAVRDLEDEMTRALSVIPADKRRDVLLQWQKENPLVRNVFIWRHDRGLVMPDAGPAATGEERGFTLRYDSLFREREAWRAGGAAGETAAPPPPEPSAMQQQGAWQPDAQQQEAPQQNASFDRRQMRQQVAKGNWVAVAPAEPLGGWIPWYSGRQLNLLGWIEDAGARERFGVELEMMSVLSRLFEAFPPRANGAGALALLDGDGRVLHQAGVYEIRETDKPSLSVPLHPALPHWSVAWYEAPGGGSSAARKTVRLASALVVGAFLVSLLAGGSLLLWQAHRNAREAVQKTTFVSNVSHELKTPLTTIRMYADMLGEGRVADPQKRMRYLDVIIRESERLTRLVNNVLDFGRIEERRKKYRPEPVELCGWLADLAARHRPRIEEAGLRLEMRLPEHAVEVVTDRDAIEQAVLNLVDNAMKYAAAGREIEIALGGGPARAEIDVRDRGPGVPRALRERIFEKFYRADDSLTSTVPGSGLGLTIARRLVRDLGGDLVYQTREGGGACFRIFLARNASEGTA